MRVELMLCLSSVIFRDGTDLFLSLHTRISFKFISKGLTVGLFHRSESDGFTHSVKRLKRRWKLLKPQSTLEPLTLRCCVNQWSVCRLCSNNTREQHLAFLKHTWVNVHARVFLCKPQIGNTLQVENVFTSTFLRHLNTIVLLWDIFN